MASNQQIEDTFKLACLSCDSGKVIDSDWINTVLWSEENKEFYCLKCDNRWQVK